MTFTIRYDECYLPFWRWKVSSCSGQLCAVRCAAPSCVCLVFARGCIDPAARCNWRYLGSSSTTLAFYYARSRSAWVPVIAFIATRTLISNHFQHTLLISAEKTNAPHLRFSQRYIHKVFWYVMPCHWTISGRSFKGLLCIFRGLLETEGAMILQTVGHNWLNDTKSRTRRN